MKINWEDKSTVLGYPYIHPSIKDAPLQALDKSETKKDRYKLAKSCIRKWGLRALKDKQVPRFKLTIRYIERFYPELTI